LVGSQTSSWLQHRAPGGGGFHWGLGTPCSFNGGQAQIGNGRHMPDKVLRPSRAGARLSSHRGASGLGSRKGSHSSVIRGSKAQIGDRRLPGPQDVSEWLGEPGGCFGGTWCPSSTSSTLGFSCGAVPSAPVACPRSSCVAEQGARRKAQGRSNAKAKASGLRQIGGPAELPLGGPTGQPYGQAKPPDQDLPPAAQQGPA
jgi:hypothetical protein